MITFTIDPAATPEEAARELAAGFNTAFGGQYLTVATPLADVTVAELRTLARKHPGPYLAFSAFEQIKGRRPTHGETIKLARLLSALGVGRRFAGSQTLWLLDEAAAERLS